MRRLSRYKHVQAFGKDAKGGKGVSVVMDDATIRRVGELITRFKYGLPESPDVSGDTTHGNKTSAAKASNTDTEYVRQTTL